MIGITLDYEAVFSAGFGFALGRAVISASPIDFDLTVVFARIIRSPLVQISDRITQKIPMKFRFLSFNLWSAIKDVEQIWKFIEYSTLYFSNYELGDCAHDVCAQ